MNATEFAELVDWVQDRWGSADEVWANSARFASDFTPFPADDVWAALYAKGKGSWAPRPMELLDGARDLARNRARPERQTQLAAPKGASWAEWCRDRFGRRRSFHEVIRERHAEWEGCVSPHCEIHRDDPVPGGLLEGAE